MKASRLRSLKAVAGALLTGAVLAPMAAVVASRHSAPAKPAALSSGQEPKQAPLTQEATRELGVAWSPAFRCFQSIETGAYRDGRKAHFGERQRVAMFRSRGGGKKRGRR